MLSQGILGDWGGNYTPRLVLGSEKLTGETSTRETAWLLVGGPQRKTCTQKRSEVQLLAKPV